MLKLSMKSMDIIILDRLESVGIITVFFGCRVNKQNNGKVRDRMLLSSIQIESVTVSRVV